MICGEGTNVPYLLPASSCAFVELPHYLAQGPPGDIEASSHATEHDAGRDTYLDSGGYCFSLLPIYLF